MASSALFSDIMQVDKMDTASMIVKTINYHGQQLSKIMEDKQLKILGSINVRDVNYHAYQQRAKDLRYVTSTSFCA